MDVLLLLLTACFNGATSSIFTPEKTKDEIIFEDMLRGRLTLKRNQLECVEDAKVEPDLVLRLKKGDWLIKDDNLKNWTLCITNKSGILSKEGVLRMDVALHSVPEEDIIELEMQINRCINSTEIPSNEIAWQFVKCYKNLTPKPKYNIF